MAQVLFDKLAYKDKLTQAGIPDQQARAHADAMDEALRESVATKSDIANLKTELENKIDLVVRDLTIRMGIVGLAMVTVLSVLKFWG